MKVKKITVLVLSLISFFVMLAQGEVPEEDLMGKWVGGQGSVQCFKGGVESLDDTSCEEYQDNYYYTSEDDEIIKININMF